MFFKQTKQYTISILFFNKYTFKCFISKNFTGANLLCLCITRLGVTIPDYYGLRYRDPADNKDWKWLDLRQNVITQITVNFGNYHADCKEFYNNQLSTNEIDQTIVKYSKMAGQTSHQTELLILLEFARYPFYNLTFYRAIFRETEKFIGLNSQGFYMFDEQKNHKYHISWIYFEEIVAVKDTCILRLINYPPITYNDLMTENLEDILEGSANVKNPKLVRELKLKFKKRSQLKSFYDDFTQNRYFYIDAGSKNQKNKPKGCLANNLAYVRRLHPKSSTHRLDKRYSIKSLNFLINSPITEFVNLEDLEDFTLIFDYVPMKIKNTFSREHIFTSSIIDTNPPKQYTDIQTESVKCNTFQNADESRECVTENFKSLETIHDTLHQQLTSDNSNNSSNEQVFQKLLVCDSELKIEDHITIDEDLNQTIEKNENYFTNQQLTSTINKENLSEHPKLLPAELQKFLKSNEALAEALITHIDENMATPTPKPSNMYQDDQNSPEKK
ncbi:hypothetical protein RF11_05401 [Thelohanellus kitauei]|uniref:FERM N-terminal domain-containing protein n=1 Tax=Thelohanellus kitauei TaxID=669202 RepID=A0A0C2J7R6_THEKT|nr:hypothetical protein RF11_05401 [Thelohanellus kitauei]